MPRLTTTEIKEVEKDNAPKAFYMFMTNVHLFTPKDREKLVALFQHLLLPKYVVQKVEPINEEWLQNKGKEIMEDRGDDSGKYEGDLRKNEKGGDADD